MNNADMPAMPINEDETDRVDIGIKIYTGLTKREHFSGLAMQGLLSNPVMGDSDLHPNAEEWRDDIIGCSLEFADALLTELDKVVAK
jgi:hypothetical protein